MGPYYRRTRDVVNDSFDRVKEEEKQHPDDIQYSHDVSVPPTSHVILSCAYAQLEREAEYEEIAFDRSLIPNRYRALMQEYDLRRLDKTFARHRPLRDEEKEKPNAR